MPSFLLRVVALIEGRADNLPIEAPKALPTDADFQAMLGKQLANLIKVTRKFASGDFEAEEWAQRMLAILFEGHAHAAYMGRQLALQEVVDPDEIDMTRGQLASDSEKQFVQRFATDLLTKDPRYWDEEAEAWIEQAIVDRQSFYLGKMRGTANQAFIEESPADADIYWRTGATEDHCTECPEYAAMSPWKRDELPTWPGDNETPCKFNCDCHLEINGIAGFKPVRF